MNENETVTIGLEELVAKLNAERKDAERGSLFHVLSARKQNYELIMCNLPALNEGDLPSFKAVQKEFRNWSQATVIGSAEGVVDILSTCISKLTLDTPTCAPAYNSEWQKSNAEGFCVRIVAFMHSSGTAAGYYLGKIESNKYAAFGYGLNIDATEVESDAKNRASRLKEQNALLEQLKKEEQARIEELNAKHLAERLQRERSDEFYRLFQEWKDEKARIQAERKRSGKCTVCDKPLPVNSSEDMHGMCANYYNWSVDRYEDFGLKYENPDSVGAFIVNYDEIEKRFFNKCCVVCAKPLGFWDRLNHFGRIFKHSDCKLRIPVPSREVQ